MFARCCFRLMGCAQTRVSLSRRTLIGFGASVTKMGFHAQPRADTLKATVSVNKRRAGVIARAETGPPGRPAGIWGTPGLLAGGSPLGRAPMHKPNGLHLLAALLAFTALAGAYALVPNWKARSNTRRAQLERTRSRPRRRERCRSLYRRGALNWA